jgi:hypothetical protein
MRTALSFAFLAVLATAASAATIDTPAGKVDIPQPSDQYVGRHTAPPADPDVSWGKTGISYDQYQYDAHYCAATGVLLALKAPAWALNKGGTTSLTDALEQRWQNPQLIAFGENNLEHCLAVRGYSKFRLTPQQMAHLQALAHGSIERHHYLYSLGSDAEVLARQKL